MIPTITHEDLARLAETAGGFLAKPGLGGRVEPGCLATETHRMADTYVRLSKRAYDVGFSERQRRAAMDAAERAFRTGMAMGLARLEELLEERGFH